MFSIAISHQNIVPVFHTFFNRVMPSICNTVRFIVTICTLSIESPNSLTDFNLHAVKFTILTYIMDFDNCMVSRIHYHGIVLNSFITLKVSLCGPFSVSHFLHHQPLAISIICSYSFAFSFITSGDAK